MRAIYGSGRDFALNSPVWIQAVAARLRAERERLGLDQETMADLGKVSHFQQRNFEWANSPPCAYYLALLAEATGIDVLYVLTGRRQSPGLTPSGCGRCKSQSDALTASETVR